LQSIRLCFPAAANYAAARFSFTLQRTADANSTLSITLFAPLLFSSAVGLFEAPPVGAHERNSSAQDTAETRAAKKEPWKPEDVIYAESAAPQTRISPDARWLVWVKSTGDKDKDLRVSNLILSSLTENKEIQLTRGSDNNAQPQWSPDGQLIVFTSNRARFGAKPDTAPVQIWLINAHGGEPWVLTELARPPRRVDWITTTKCR
jgi:hypothetical protein